MAPSDESSLAKTGALRNHHWHPLTDAHVGVSTSLTVVRHTGMLELHVVPDEAQA